MNEVKPIEAQEPRDAPLKNSTCNILVESKDINSKCNNYKGIILAILSALCISCGGIFYKKAETMTGSDNSVLRYVYQFIIMLGILLYNRKSILGPKDQRKLLVIRAFFSIFSVVSTNFSLNFIHPSDSVALSHTNIILIAIMAKLFLKDKLNLSHIIALFFTILGIILISKPSFIFGYTLDMEQNETKKNLCQSLTSSIYNAVNRDIYEFIGIAFALVGAAGSATIHICIKKLAASKVHYSIISFYGTFLGLPTSLIISSALVLSGKSHKNLKCEITNYPFDIIYGSIGGLFAVAAHVLLNLSLQYEDTTKVGILRTTDLLFSFILQYLILKIKTDYIEVLGGLSIILGTLVISFYKIFLLKFSK
jgi:drug/metabolite transporter (DMT)-like permease